jgi:outer membrane protein OmpA-like peptidoglycan-associated protein
LERANRRVEELESATSEREQRIIQFEADWKEALSQSEQLNKQLDTLREELEAAEKHSGRLQSENSELNRQIEAGTDRGEMLSRRVVELEQRIEQLQTEVEEAQVHRDDARESISKLEASLSSSDERVMDLSRQIEEKDQELGDWKSQVDALAEEHSQHQEKLREAEQVAASAKAEYEERLATASLDAKTLQEKQGGLVSQHSKELERLKKTWAEKEAITKSLSQQREKGVAEIERLRLKVSKRGQSIRDLQNEVSSIMMQRANRDDEIAMLKNKLRAVESELEDARKATKAVSNMAVAESPSLKSFEKTLQLTLSEEMAKGPGKPLDQIESDEEQALVANHEVPKPKKVLNLQAPVPTESEGGIERKEPEPKAAPVASVEEPQESEPVPENQKSSSPEILFGEQSAELSGEAKQAIDEMARKIRKGANRLAVSIIGFAGAEGSPDYSERLSAQRADAVRERLLARGVAQTMLTVRGAGQDRRFTDARARRVELILESKAVAEAVN